LSAILSYIECYIDQEIFASIQDDDIFVPLARFQASVAKVITS
jgi:hypothetical protein